MASEWPEFSLTDLYRVSSGLSKPAKDFGEGFPFLSFKDVFYNTFIPSELTQLVKSTEREREKCSVQRGDVFLTRTSETMDELGMSCVARKDYPEATFNGFCKRLRPETEEEVFPEYVAYFLRSPQFRNELGAFSTMSTRASLNNDMIGRLKIKLPPLPEQKAIAHILGSLDDKIELNRRMNETLEGMAQALFKSWFVDFDPVIDNALEAGNPIPEAFAARAATCQKALTNGIANREAAKAFPSSFIETDEMGWIPEGWEVAEIRDRTKTIQYGLTQSASEEACGPKFLRITDIRGGKIEWGQVPYCEVSSEQYEKYKVSEGDIFVARTGASTGENIYITSPDKSVFASYLVRFTFDEKSVGRIVGMFMRSAQYFDHIDGILGGSAQPNASAQALASAQMVFPEDSVSDLFYDKVISFDRRRATNAAEIRTLSKLRDTLLPKLISGELRIEDAEKMVGDVAE